MIEENKEQEAKINLPPLPDDAVEFGNLSIESMIDPSIDRNMPTVNGAKKAMPGSSLEEFVSSDNTDKAEAEFAQKDLDIELPIIVDNPMPTLADPSKEFNPESTQNALDDFDGEGGSRKAIIGGPTILSSNIIKTEDINLGNKISNFNAGTIQNALLNNEIEGGIVTNKSTGSMKIENGDVSKDGKQIRETDKNEENKRYRVYGFLIQYKSKNTARENIIVTEAISDYYDSLDKAMISVNGSKYLKLLDNGAFDVVDIVSGSANISFQDQNLYTYTGGKIGVGGYWKRA